MTYFISHPSACRLYVKCNGWQETLAHFFVKSRRPSVPLLSPNQRLSYSIISTEMKDPNLDSNHRNSVTINANDNNQLLTPISSMCDISINSDDSSSEKQIQKLDNEITDMDLTQTYKSSTQSLLSVSTVTSMEN